MNSKYSAGDILIDKSDKTAYFIFEVFIDELIYYKYTLRNPFDYQFEEGIIGSFWLDENKDIQKVGEDVQKAEQMRSLRNDITKMLSKQIGLLLLD